MASKEPRVRDLIAKWSAYRGGIAEPDRYLVLKSDLYKVRNAAPGLSPYPAHLIDPDDEIMASVEHYFLCRGWVGNAQYSSAQVRLMKGVYNVGKELGVTPRHNPTKPVTPPSAMQVKFQDEGIRDGEADLKKSGKKAPFIGQPPKYF